MAIARTYITSLCIMNVIIVSPVLEAVKSLLEKQADMVVKLIQPLTLNDVFEQIGEFHPDIFIITQDLGTINGDILCHFLSKHYCAAQSLILINEEPTFEMLRNSGFKVRGYIAKEQARQIDKAVRVVHAGEAWLPRRLVAEMLNRFELQVKLSKV